MGAILNQKVTHIKFGDGIIISESNEKITAKFEKLEDNKIFQYPDAFECFLEFENKAFQESALKELKDKKEKAIIEKAENRLESLRKDEELKIEAAEIAKKNKKAAKAKK